MKKAASAKTYVHDPVNHPEHYTAGRKIEPIDAILDWGLDWMTGNCVKYLTRAGRKDDRLTDLRKAKFYLDRAIAELEAARGKA